MKNKEKETFQPGDLVKHKYSKGIGLVIQIMSEWKNSELNKAKIVSIFPVNYKNKYSSSYTENFIDWSLTKDLEYGEINGLKDDSR